MEIGTVKLVHIEEEMRGAYLDYAMSVITARALPDVRDGLKPVQRRILYAMDEIGLRHNTPYKKSARIVGEVLGKYHPHGDAPVYESMVRMAQDFSMRYPLVDGQGNFGSVDGDPPAAMRYTEARMAAIAEEMLADIDKNTVDFAPNFDGTLKEPTVLPAKIPNLLLNGSAGIAVGMATNIPPHNLNELVDAIVLMIDHFGNCLDAGVPFDVMWPRVLNIAVAPEVLAGGLKAIKSQLAARINAEALKISEKPTDETRGEALVGIVDEMVDITPDKLLAIVKGPDFPTAGIILGDEGIKNAYITGHGRIAIRAKAHAEEMRGNRHQIIVTELPYQVNKASLLEKIAELVRDRRIEGISELRDESDRQGMRIVIELKRETKPTQILNQLFKYTSMQSAFSINMLALVDGQPRVLTLKSILLHYINFRKEVITRRTIYDLERARLRAHILQGLKIALDNLDEVIATIRRSRDAETARTALMKNFKLSEIQAQAILDMQLRRLAALERKKILDELAETLKLIGYLEDLLAHPGKILFLIKDELNQIKEKYGDARRTRITTEAVEEFTEEDLIPDQEVAITVSAKGYVKRMAADSFRLQRRARAIAGTVAREEDAPQIVLTASTLDQILFVTNRGRAYNIKAHELPDTGRQARGLPLSNFFSLQPDERAVGAVAIRSFERDAYLLYVTRNGDVKRVALSEYSSTRSAGINALNIAEKDELVFVGLGEGKSELMVFSEGGQAIRFNEDEVRASGRTSGGIRAIRLKGDDRVAAAGTVRGEQVVVVTQNGFHKRCSLSEFPMQSRGGGGVRAHSVTSKTGPLAGATVAADGDEILIVSSGGLVLRSPVDAIPAAGRATQGTALSGLDKKDKISGVARLESREGPGKQPIEATADGGSPSTAAPSSRGEAKTSANSGGKGIAKTASKSDQTQETAELKTSSKSKGAQAGGKPASAAKESAKQSAKKSAKATASSKTVTSKGAKAKAPATKVVQKSTPPAKAKKTVEAEPEERFTQRIIIPPREETAKPAKSPAPKPSVRSSASTASSKPAEKDGQAKKSTLFGSIASSLSKSVSGEKKQPEGKAAPQPTLPLFGGSQGKKETIEPSSADGKKTAGAGKAKSEPEKKSPAAKAVKAATKPAKPKK